ncbi:hypothetical protein M2227_001962 [Bradyrhizobium elkanii]|nr:hypothetical protein [Bradyrhizobium elkanii]
MAELTLETARKILDAALAKGVEKKFKPLVVTILDARGAVKVTVRAGPGCLDSAALDLSGFLPGYAERGALRFCRCVGRA